MGKNVGTSIYRVSFFPERDILRTGYFDACNVSADESQNPVQTKIKSDTSADEFHRNGPPSNEEVEGDSFPQAWIGKPIRAIASIFVA